MDFKQLYEKFHKLSIGCDITDKFNINRLIVGHGGSSNIILDVVDKNNNPLIIKIMPEEIYYNVEKKPDYSQLEIKFYEFFTQKFILTDRTPHIVGIYNHQNCQQLDTMLNTIRPKNKQCPTYQDKLSKKIDLTIAENMICELLQKRQFKLIDSMYDLVLLEYCETELFVVIDWFMEQIKKSYGKQLKSIINEFIHVLHRILFQIIFTLVIIQDDYPGFSHGDFFVRNILVSIERNHQENDYVAYHYRNDKVFYLLANGEYAKINDFGMSLIANELVANTYETDKIILKYQNRNPFNKKNDIFNLLHDLYDGESDHGIIAASEYYKVDKDKLKPIIWFVSEFIDTNSIDMMNMHNKNLLDQTWFIDGIEILESVVKTPTEYLMSDLFAELQTLPKNGRIIKHYNQK